jgi:cation diffusion facilitator CzcD-associated flavoprotein CzcO
MTATKPSDETASPGRPLRVIIIGAGLSGIMSAIKLAQAGYRDVTVFEKADRLGGTWRENTYPGVACDVPSHVYSYSFAPNPNWSRVFSPGSEIQAYIEAVARRYEIEPRIRFSEEVTRCEFADGQWRVETSRGQRYSAEVVIAATGVTHHPKLPDIHGLASFAGPAFHSARWDHGVELAGRRLGIIGTGSTAVQLVSALVDRVGKLLLFQRTAQWIAPQDNPPYTPEQRAAFREQPEMQRAMRAELERRFVAGFSDAVVDVNSPQLEVIAQNCRANLESQVRDPALREKLRPNYRAACKRLVISPDFYQAIQHPNAELVCEGIEAIEPKGVRTRDGRLHELDVLVFATGFQTDRFVRPTEVIGSEGRRLAEVWAKRPTAYLSVVLPGFPNFFMLNGPSSPVGNFSLIDVAERQMAYALQLIEQLRSGACREISPSEDAAASFEAARVEATKHTVWVSGCKSWYLDDRGVPASWPWTLARFRAELAAPDLAAYVRRS